MLTGYRVKSIGYAFLCFIFHWSAIVPIIISIFLYKMPALSNRKNAFIYTFISLFFCLTVITPTFSIGSVVFYFANIIDLPFFTIKVNSYFSGHGIYSMSLFNRLSLFYEPIVFTLIITFSFFSFYNKPKLKDEVFLINTFFALLLYAVLNVTMEHSYRNFYWAQILIPLVVIQLINSVKNRVKGELRPFYLFVVTIVIVISSLGLWRSGILYLLYN